MRILMVSTEYPPMPGGVGRYTAILTRELRKLGFDVYVACNDKGKGEFFGISPGNVKNSDVLLEIVDKIKPDVVHIQFEPGMYGLIIDTKDPRKSGTYIDSFYRKCKTPITTTFHSGYTLTQWMNQASLIKKSGRIGRLGIPLRFLIRFWKYFLNYKAFKNLNKDKLGLSRAGIVFSCYMSNILGGGRVIYHGAEPSIPPNPENKRNARSMFSLPQDGRIALALGFKTSTKGWDIIKKIVIPSGWRIVINSSKSYYNTENYDEKWEEDNNNNSNNNKNNIIDLQRGLLSEEELSMLFYAADVVILPYKVTAGSGVMFDALAHGLPFIATNLGFFKEFAALGLGVTVKRDPREFSNGIKNLDRNYSNYTKSINAFKQKLKWDFVASQHASIYQFAAGKGQER
jgi:glycosyltransferase involved in cell wall biosynthesis